MSGITALYGRKSLYVKDSISVEMQLKKGRQLCGNNETIVEYIDEGFSGKNMKRPAFQSLMDDVKNGRIQKVIVYKIDRFSRSLADFSQTWDILNEHNVEFVSVKEQFDTSAPMGKAMLFILMVFAQLERETVAERVTDNYYERVKLGSWPGGPPPYGFDNGRIKDSITSDRRSSIPTLIQNDKIYVVKEIFERYLDQDVSLGQISRELLEKDIPSIKSKTWTNVSLARLLHNPSYVMCDVDVYNHFKSLGVRVSNSINDFTGEYGGLLVGKRGAASRKRNEMKDAKFSLANWKGSVSSEVYLAVQLKLEKNEQVGNAGKGKHTWLSGLLKCGYCEKAMVITTYKNERNFRCSGRSIYICDYITNVSVDDVEYQAERQIIEMLKRCEDEAEVIEEEFITNSDKMKITCIEEKICNLMNCISAGIANETTIHFINQEIEKLVTEQKELLNKVGKKRRNKKLKLEKIDYEKLEFEDKKLVARSLIEKINIFESDIEIIWKL